MPPYLLYPLILALLFLLERSYFRIADHFNIIDKPNERSSHSTIVLRGGGVIFLLALWVWFIFFGFRYPLWVVAVTLAAGISFADDIKSLPDSLRLVAQFVAMGLMIAQLWLVGRAEEGLFWNTDLLAMLGLGVLALVICVGATNIYNFMDGINGITAFYSAAALIPLFLVNLHLHFIEESLLIVIALSLLVFAFYNARPRGKARCFAGDVGSVGMAFILLFLIGRLVLRTGDVTWLIFLLVYGADGCFTICHRILLHENLGQAHRKHVFQLMANELKMSHPLVSLIYMGLQLAISLGFVYFCPDTVLAHWIYLLSALALLAVAYILFKKKYYHLHEEYLASLGK